LIEETAVLPFIQAVIQPGSDELINYYGILGCN